jgi:DNA-binding IscR family transcriptional regulator
LALLRAIRESDEENYIDPNAFENDAGIDQLVENVENSVASALKGRMIKDLVSSDLEDHHSIKPVAIGATQ